MERNMQSLRIVANATFGRHIIFESIDSHANIALK